MIKPYDNFDVTAAGGTIDVSCNTTDIAFVTSSGTVTLGAPLVIQPDPLETLYAGNTIQIIWSARVLLAASTVTILDIVLTQEQASKDLVIFGSCDGSAWTGQILIDSADGTQAVDIQTWTNAGGTIKLKSGIDANYQVVTSASISLLGSYVIEPDSTHTFVEGDYFFIKYEGQIALNGNTITIFSKNLPQIQATIGNTMVFAKYDGSAWRAIMWQGVDNNMYRLMGSSADTSPDFLDQKVQNSIVVSTNKLELDGDVASPAGSSYYGTDAGGTKGWHAMGGNILSTTVTLTDADILTGNSAPVEVVANPGVGFAVVIDSVLFSIKGTAGVVTPYATNTTIHIITDTANDPQIIDTSTLVSTVNRAANNSTTQSLTGTPSRTILITNKSVYFKVSTGDPTAGDAGNTLTLTIFYRVIAI